MSDTFLRVCCPTRRHVQMRGGDGRQAANERAQAAPGPRRASTGKRRAPCRSCTSRGRFAPIGDALGASDRGRWCGSRKASWVTRATATIVRCAAGGIGATVEEGLDLGRICHGAVDAAAHCRPDPREVRSATGHQLGLGLVGADGVECAAADRPGTPARRARHLYLEEQEVARAKKIAARQRRIIVFIDESGLSERPCRARTWSPRGETPVLQYSFSWKQLSAIAGVSLWRFYFRLFPGSIKSPQIVEFLKALSATIGKKVLIIWDRLQAHRSRLVREYVEQQRGTIALEYLPAYAPELNPVECIWGYLNSHAMPNFCARDLTDLKRH